MSRKKTTPPSTRYGVMAGRWSRVAANLLASGLVLIGGLTFGRHILRLWNAAPASQASSQPTHSDDESDSTQKADAFGEQQKASVGFGESALNLVRRSVAGDKNTALAALRKDCQSAVEQIRQPPRSTPGPWERRLLKHLKTERPVLEEQGKWEIHKIDGPFPLVAGLRYFPQKAGAPTGRIVVWGLGAEAEPPPDPPSGSAGASRWMLFTSILASGSPSSSAKWIAKPPGGWTIMSLQKGKGTIAAFAGVHQPKVWREYFDDWMKARGKPAAMSWRSVGNGWRARFGDTTQGWVDVQFMVTAAGATPPATNQQHLPMTGVMTVTYQE